MAAIGRHMRQGADAPATDVGRPHGRWLPLACLLAATAVVVLVTLVQPPKYATPDDFMQHLYARGAYFDTPGLLMLYSLFPFSAPLCLLYDLVPGVAWYPVVLLGLVAVSAAVMLDLALRVEGAAPPRALLAAAVLACEVMVTVYLSYTIVAFVAFAAGVALLLAHAGFVRPASFRLSDFLAYLLVVEGFSLRPESGLAAAAVFAPFLVWALVRNRNARTLLMAAGVVACMAACYVGGHAAWRLTDGWQTFDETFSAAQAVADYPRVSADDAARVAPKLSENDLSMIYEFLFVDADVYDLATFQALDGVVRRYSVDTLLGAVLARPTFTAFVAGLVVVLFALAVLVCAARGLRGGRRALALFVPVMVGLLLLVVFLRARPKMHVVLPLFVVGTFALVVAALVPADERGWRDDGDVFGDATSPETRAGLCALGIAVYAGLALFVEVKYALPLTRSLSAELTANMQDYVDEHPDQLVAFTLSQGGLTNYDAFAFDAWDHPSNAVFIGGYEYYTAPWQTFLEESGLSRDGFLRNLLGGRRMVTVGTDAQAELVRAYLSEHAGKEVAVERVVPLGTGTQTDDEYAVWRYDVAGATESEPETESVEAPTAEASPGEVPTAEGSQAELSQAEQVPQVEDLAAEASPQGA